MYALRTKLNSEYYFGGYYYGGIISKTEPYINKLSEGGIVCFSTKEMADCFLDWNKKILNTTYLDLCSTVEEIEKFPNGLYTEFEVVEI